MNLLYEFIFPTFLFPVQPEAKGKSSAPSYEKSEVTTYQTERESNLNSYYIPTLLGKYWATNYGFHYLN